jgi:hypothetical protein
MNIDSLMKLIDLFFSQSPLEIVVELFAIFAWIIFVNFLIFAVVIFYADYVQDKKNQNWKYIVLAIDIPQLNLQTPKAVEQIFSNLSGAFSKPDIIGKFREGYKQKWFSFEIISIGGYIQFLVWTEESFKDLVEASIYAQYPEAEITEVEDYVDQIPDKYPNPDYDIWMADFTLAENFAFPIRCYDEFVHNITKEDSLKDPMSSFLESFARIGHGEQMWFQILIQPVDNSWKEKVIEKIKDFIGEKTNKKSLWSFILGSKVGDEIAQSLKEIKLQMTGYEGSTSSAEADKGPKNNLQFMTPGQRKLVESMEKKIEKIGFKTKMRTAYIARKEIYNPERGVNSLIGSINQFNNPSSNSLVIQSSTFDRNLKKASIKKTNFFKAYKKRKINFGANAFILNIEELASVWHFPMSNVRAPLLQKSTTKVSEPPASLPVEYLSENFVFEEQKDIKKIEEKKFKTDTGEVINFD